MARSPQQRLMDCLQKGDLVKFRELLDKHGKPLVDVNHVYGDPHYMTCLAKAANAKDNFEQSAEFIRALLDKGADPNKRFEVHQNNSALHFAVQRNNVPALQELLDHDNTKVNLRNKRNQSPVYLAALFLPESQGAFEKLIFHNRVRVQNEISKLTAIGKAAERKCDVGLLQRVIEHVNYLRKEDKKLITSKYDLDVSCIPDDTNESATTSSLYRLLELEKTQEFKDEIQVLIKSIDDSDEAINKVEELISADDNLKMTFLQLASWSGYLDVMELLVNLGVDINGTTEDEKRPPVHLACYKGNLSVLKFLIDKGADLSPLGGKTVLHTLFVGLISTRGKHKECFDFLLKMNDVSCFLNQEDEYGHTALHYAILEKDYHYATELLKRGAYIGVMNQYGVSPLHDMEPEVLEVSLDNCITREEEDKSQHYTLRVNFKILKPCAQSTADLQESEARNGEVIPLQSRDAESGGESCQQLREMYPLFRISQSKKLQHLLNHPVLLMFLHLKWQRVMMVFLLNIIFFTLFVIFLTVDIFCRSCDSSPCSPGATGAVRVIFSALFVILIFRETFQVAMLPNKLAYVKNLENVLELGICLFTVLILTGICSKFLTAITLILTWTEFILQFGCIQRLAVYNEMLKRVTWNYLKFLLWFLPLIMAFTLSFYNLYHVEQTAQAQNETQNSTDFYSDLSLSFLKTVVMMIGEYDAASMEFSHGGKLVFLFFVFMITIVLLNLLNGLAVSDTQAIRDDAELVILKFRVKLVHQFESVIFSKEGLSTYIPWRKQMMERVTLFPEAFPDDCLLRELTQNKKIGRYLFRKAWRGKDSEHRPDECFTFGKWRFGCYIDPAIFDAAKEIADRRHSENDTVSTIAQVQELKQEVSQIKNDLSELTKILHEFLDKRSS